MAIRSNNKIARSKFYPEILQEYNTRFSRDGKVNKKRFFMEVVQPRIKISYQAFTTFIAKFETEAGLQAVAILDRVNAANGTPISAAATEVNAIKILKDSAVATREGIARALNIGVDALQEIIDHPDLLSAKDRADILFKAMKAQDSRIGATAKVRADVREQVKFNKTFSRAAFVGGDEV